MLVFATRRLVVSFLTLLVASFFVYVLVANSGDPYNDIRELPPGDREAQFAQRTERLQLDVPVPLRYLGWLRGVGGCLVPGGGCDLGLSKNGQEVSVLVGQAAVTSVRLVLGATVLAMLIGIGVGIVSALKQYSRLDYSVTFAAFVFFSLPVFVIGIVLKQYLAIAYNDWLADPRVPVPVVAAAAVVVGALVMSAVPGRRAWRWLGFAAGAAVTAAVLLQLSALGWFARPALGVGLVGVLSVAAAVGVTFLVSGLHRRRVLVGALVTALIGTVASVPLQPLFDVSTWGTMGVLLVVTVALSALVGAVAGGPLERAEAVRAAVLTGVLTAALVFTDRLLASFADYARSVGGRPLSTIGAQTPNFSGDFWETTMDQAMHLVLPTLSLVLISLATYSRYTRSSMLEVLNAEHVRTARAKGLTERTVVVRHAFRNGLIPIATFTAIDFGAVIGGAVISERVFGWQGMGNLFITGLGEVDPNPVMAFFVVTSVAIVVFNLVADLAYAFLDPRIRLS